jgi:LmbE family N-acetylglucosaminyl deacetylase
MVHLRWGIFLLISFCATGASRAEALIAPPKILIVVAHPDDEYYFAATTYRLAVEKGAIVDELVITNGEAGFHYASLSEKYYQLPLHDEKIARARLPAIREKELEGAGKVLGIHSHILLNQADFGFTQDENLPLQKWDVKLIREKLASILAQGKYDFVFVIQPIPSTHGHHKAATLLALEAVNNLPEKERPVVLAAFAVPQASKTNPRASTSISADHEIEIQESRDYHELKRHPLTKITDNSVFYTFDRNQKFGLNQKLSYQIVVNWMITEHKSQDFFQTFIGQDDEERFSVFDLNGAPGVKKTAELFQFLK